MKFYYDKLNTEDLITRKRSGVKSTKGRKLTKIILHLIILVLIAQFSILAYCSIKIRDEIIDNFIKEKELNNINDTILAYAIKQKEEETNMENIIYKKESLLLEKTKKEKLIKLLNDQKKKFVAKLKSLEYSLKLSKTITSILSPKYIMMTEAYTGCVFIRDCYRMSRDGFKAQTFHQNCDGLKPTVALVKTQNGEIFGGITYESWDGSGVKYDSNTFLFSLALEKTFPLKKDKVAINTSPQLFPTFGNEDIYISETTSYACSPLVSFGTSNIDYCDESRFEVKDIEVFHMNCNRNNNA